MRIFFVSLRVLKRMFCRKYDCMNNNYEFTILISIGNVMDTHTDMGQCSEV